MDPEIIAGRLWVKAKIRELVEANEAPVQAIRNRHASRVRLVDLARRAPT